MYKELQMYQNIIQTERTNLPLSFHVMFTGIVPKSFALGHDD